jgi:hypothetical protein
VVRVEGDSLILDDTEAGQGTIAAADAFIEPRREYLAPCLAALYGNSSEKIRGALEARIAEANSGPNRLDRVRRVVEFLSKQKLEMVPGHPFSLSGTVVTQRDAAISFPSVSVEERPTYVFDPSGTRTSTWHDGGLDQHGPYDQKSFTPASPKVAVVCQARFRGQTEQFLHKLFEGIQGVADRRGRLIFGKGLLRKYYLEKCHLQFFEAISPAADSYKKAVDRAVAAATDRNERWDLAIVQTENAFHSLAGDENPYLVTKAAFLAHGMPSQEVKIETMSLPDGQLVYALNNIALASYAKMGGIAWLLSANKAIAHELVFGMGSARVGEGRLGDRERVVGITTVFTGDGNYLVENRSRAVPFADYPAALLDSLRDSVNLVKQRLNWQPRDSVRLVFHAFKPFRSEQIDAVAQVVSDLGDYDTEFAFLHVVEDHPFLLFDEARPEGEWDAKTKAKKGHLAPLRGQCLKLGDFERLLVLTGAREVKRPQDGLPSPILLRLDKKSTFKDMTYLTRQVYQFSCHSWRSFFPAPMPITILYSELIAHLLGNLSRLTRWNPDALLGRVGRTRWFL